MITDFTTELHEIKFWHVAEASREEVSSSSGPTYEGIAKIPRITLAVLEHKQF